MFLLLAIIIIWSERKEYLKLKMIRHESLLSDYPHIVSKLSLLTLAGLNIRNALERICQDASITSPNVQELHPAYEEILYTCSQIKNGVYESLAYEDLGRRCAIPQYAKLSSYLVTGLSRGSKDFNRLLAEEATSALIEQKAQILRQGERASAKLMGPMMLIFLSILCLIMIPAFLSMSL